MGRGRGGTGGSGGGSGRDGGVEADLGATRRRQVVAGSPGLEQDRQPAGDRPGVVAQDTRPVELAMDSALVGGVGDGGSYRPLGSNSTLSEPVARSQDFSPANVSSSVGLRSRVTSKTTPNKQEVRREEDTDEKLGEARRTMESPEPKAQRPSWLFLALASGTFAAFNGAFAKLTTTSNLPSLTNLLPLAPSSPLYPLLNLLPRAFFLLLNVISNAIMWTLFTRALTANPSATRVSLLNTSANFLVTAVLGLALFGEQLSGLWWVGAAFLVVGNVIIGRQTGPEGEGADAPEKESTGEGLLGGEGIETEPLLDGGRDAGENGEELVSAKS